MASTWSPDRSTLAWAWGPWTFWRARVVCLMVGHQWKTSAELYGEEHCSVIPWSGACDRCGLTYGDEDDDG